MILYKYTIINVHSILLLKQHRCSLNKKNHHEIFLPVTAGIEYTTCCPAFMIVMKGHHSLGKSTTVLLHPRHNQCIRPQVFPVKSPCGQPYALGKSALFREKERMTRIPPLPWKWPCSPHPRLLPKHRSTFLASRIYNYIISAVKNSAFIIRMIKPATTQLLIRNQHVNEVKDIYDIK